MYIALIILFSISCTTTKPTDLLTSKLDDILKQESTKPFNGVVLITQNGKRIYQKVIGFADLETKDPLKIESEFIVGSISKQFTATLILQAYEAGKLDLRKPIKNYLPDLTEPWADTVSIHHLLTHTHGIEKLNEPTLFPVGTAYAYSQIGYQLLAGILEVVEGKSLAELSTNLFKKHELKSTYHPDYKQSTKLVNGYTESENGELMKEATPDVYAAAGGFTSNAYDLVRWNELIYKGKLLQDSTYQQMTSKQPNAVRIHPIFGETAYGYGVTVDTKEGILQLGLTGYVPGFCSMNFYFPDTDVSVIVLENTAVDLNDFMKTFGYHLAVLNTVRNTPLFTLIP